MVRRNNRCLERHPRDSARDKGMIPIQYRALAFVLALGLFGGGMYWWGGSNARNACSAANGKASAKVEKAEDKRDVNIEAIAAATGAAVAQQLNQNRNDSNDDAEKIRTVYIRPECRAIDTDILRNLQQARDDANAALGISVRPATASADTANR
jgi:hypothetical protein